MSPETRPPAVAGYFYPADPAELRAMVEELLAHAEAEGGDAEAWLPKAVIVPHAGYAYSGPIAASAYVQVARTAGTVERVILMGPAHRYSPDGLALPDASGLATPLGVVPLDDDGAEVARTLRPVCTNPKAHEGEHSLEVHLPFLQVVLGDFEVVPLVVGHVQPGDVPEVLEALWGGPETLIVVSSDLSHFQRYTTAREMDGATARAIEELNPDAIGFEQACGRAPVAGLLRVARKRGLRVRTVDLRNSRDTAGGHSRVVGYGAWVFAE